MTIERRFLLKGAVAASAAGLLAMTGVAGEAWSAVAGTAAPSLPDWMSQAPDDTPVQRLTVPGTHNSGARHGGPYTECQNTGIAEQLAGGIRFLDIRCRLFDGSFSIHHGATYQNLNFDDVLTACRDFLAQRPTETVLMRLKQEYSQESAGNFLDVFNGYLDGKGWRSLFRLDPALPVLGEARGKVVLLGDSDGLPGVRYGDGALFDIQDDYMAEPGRKYGLIADHFRKAAGQPGKLFVNHVSTAALLPPRSNADRLCPRVKDLLASSEGAGWRGLGIVAMDFPNEYGMPDALIPRQAAVRTAT